MTALRRIVVGVALRGGAPRLARRRVTSPGVLGASHWPSRGAFPRALSTASGGSGASPKDSPKAEDEASEEVKDTPKDEAPEEVTEEMMDEPGEETATAEAVRAAAAEGAAHYKAAEEEAAAEDAETDEAQRELAAAIAERDEYKNKFLFTLAEVENMRKIRERDVSNAREYAIQKFAKSMLEVSDSLGYALAAAQKDEAELKTIVEGVDLTKSQLTKVFNEHGLLEFGDIGDKFDPSLHEALFEIPDADKDPGTVGQVLKTGFSLKDRVIRAAQVGVTKAPPAPPPAPPSS